MILGAALISVLSISGWALWIRRDCWRSQWERSGNLCITLQACALILCTPHAECLSIAGHEITGVCDLEDFAAHSLFIWSAAAFTYHVTTRLHGVTPAFKRTLWLSIGPFTVIRFGLFATGHLVHYWILACGTTIGYTVIAAVLMSELWAEPKHRPTIIAYAAAATIGIVVCTIQIVLAMTGRAHVDLTPGVVTGCAVGTATFAFGFGHSWRRREKAIRAAAPVH